MPSGMYAAARRGMAGVLGGPGDCRAFELSARGKVWAAAQAAADETGESEEPEEQRADSKKKKSRGNRLRNELADSSGFGRCLATATLATFTAVTSTAAARRQLWSGP